MSSSDNNSLIKTEYSLRNNYYACLAPPPCQVEEQEIMTVEEGHGKVRFTVPKPKSKNKGYKCQMERYHRAKLNKLALKATRATTYRYAPPEEGEVRNVMNTMEAAMKASTRRDELRRVTAKKVYTVGTNDNEIKKGVLNGTIAYTVADSGATSNVGTADDPSQRTGKASEKVFILPGGQKAAATEIAEYPFPLRPPAAEVHITPDIVSNSLMSTGLLADANYISVFDKEEVNIYDANDVTIIVTRGAILRGWRCPVTKLWRIPLLPTVGRYQITNLNTETVLVNKPPTEFLSNRPPPAEAIFNVYELKTQPELVRYYHAAAGFPTQPTWLRAIKNNHYASWTGLTCENARKYFPESEETWKGHGRKIKSNLQSTKKKKTLKEKTEMVVEMEEEQQDNNTAESQSYKKSKTIMVKVLQLDVEDEDDDNWRLIYTDGTGRFPKQSRTGMNYVMVLAENDSDAILVEAMKNRSAGEMVRAYLELIRRLKECGIVPTKQVLDNEISDAYKEAIKSVNITYELVPPHNHERNKAEKAIQTFKNHSVATLCGTDKDFPLYLWSDILRQTEHTLNLLRPSRRLPSVSAYAYLYGQHNYDRNPFAPLGCKVEAHMMPSTRETWGEHTASGYYIGNSDEHYRCHKVYISSTRGIRVCETVFFKHKYLTQPSFTTNDALIAAADKLTAAIAGVIPTTTSTQAGIQQLLDIFKKQANAAKDDVTAQRVRMKDAASQRVNDEVMDAIQPTLDQASQRVNGKAADVRHPTRDKTNHIPAITQDEDIEEDQPTNHRPRTRSSAARTITDEFIYNMMEIPGTGNISPRSAASMKYPLQFLCDFANAVIDDETGEIMEYRHLIKNPKHRVRWQSSFGREIRRLATDTETIGFIRKSEIPIDRRKDETYARIVVDERPEKADPDRTRITMGGDKINYPGDCGTPTADLLTVKILFNSIVSTPGAKFMTLDIKDFYLMTPMDRYEYFRMKLDLFPEDIIEEYGLRDKVDDKGFVHCEVRRGMYGLPQAGLLAQQQLIKRLNKAGYTQSKSSPGYWKHEWRPISFTLVVDDFGVKYVGKEHADHLISVLQQDYTIDIDWEGTRYIGLTLDWDYEKRKVHLSMPGYILKALVRFAHEAPNKPQNQPHPHTERKFGATIQYAKAPDESARLPPEGKTFIQQVLGVLLYYGRAVDATVLVALSSIASAQETPTELTKSLVKWLLDYVATHPDAILTYEKSDMILTVHSDASYLSEPQAKSRAGGHFFLTSEQEHPPNNGAILNISKIMKTVMSSAADAELGALYINACEAVPIRNLLHDMGHKQPKTPIQTDNSTACGVVNSNIQPRQTKSMDMRFYWLRCRDSQGQFRYYWAPGPDNLADYWTKHHPADHHIAKRPTILTPKTVLDALRASTKRTPATKGKGLMKTPLLQTRGAAAA